MFNKSLSLSLPLARQYFSASTDLLPLANTPEVFGLHPNAEINYYSQTTREIWSHLIELQPQTGKLYALMATWL
jgi:dynein heavy chain